ncbi:prohibitin family protein [Leucobacter sp. cx-42]|uniref:prohibitin family protein n=1 Tax=unclassified Leucobacter TaxID=2621730 RepID=UPI00165E50FC|nr:MULTISPECIES: prohibitin family protein [unclassified Leucobacter]MBC9954911.1 prohibitin family protein [Leucobacter sp. cx-42]
MTVFVFACIFAALAVAALLGGAIVAHRPEETRTRYNGEVEVLREKGEGKGWWRLSAAALLVIALGFGFASMSYTNDEGQAKVLRSWTGEVQGEVTKPGFGLKAPWQSALTYDIRNQQVIFASSKGEPTKDANGPQITIQDKEGVSANIDISVRYSIKPDAVVDVYKRYGTQENFISKFIENDIRAGVRTVPAGYGTIQLLNGRAEVEQKITEYLDERWAKRGVQVETVSLQEIRYPKDVQQRFAEAQNARTEVEKANAELEANKVKAESNRVLAESLTETNLEQLKYETLREIGKGGNLVIVPEDFSGMVNLPANK